jgi:hypothetical protein
VQAVRLSISVNDHFRVSNTRQTPNIHVFASQTSSLADRDKNVSAAISNETIIWCFGVSLLTNLGARRTVLPLCFSVFPHIFDITEKI